MERQPLPTNMKYDCNLEEEGEEDHGLILFHTANWHYETEAVSLKSLLRTLEEEGATFFTSREGHHDDGLLHGLVGFF